MEIKLGKCYTHTKFEDVKFQVLEVKEEGMHVLWWHSKDKDELLGEDEILFGEWMQGLSEVGT
jgi:hypothetical protein